MKQKTNEKESEISKLITVKINDCKQASKRSVVSKDHPAPKASLYSQTDSSLVLDMSQQANESDENYLLDSFQAPAGAERYL